MSAEPRPRADVPAPAPPVDVASITHPSTRRTTVVLLVGAGLAAFEAAAMGLSSGPIAAVPMALLSAGAVALTFRLRTTFKAIAVHNRATDLILRGDLDGAEPMLERFSRLGGSVGQSIALQLATVSMLRGDMATCEQRATASIGHRPRLDFAMSGRALADLARSVRAFARAAQGKGEAAMEDIREVRAECMQVVPLARVAVAELLLLSRESKLEELRAALARNERVLEHAAPRERALVRGFERMVAAGGGAIYRKPQSRVSEASSATAWLSQVAPAVRGFVASESSAITSDEPAPVAVTDGKAFAPQLRPSGARRRGLKVLVLWLCLIGLFLAIWQLLSPSGMHPVPHPAEPEAPMDMTALYVGLSSVVVVLVGVVTLRIRGLRSRMRRAVDLESRALLGDEVAIRELEIVTRGRLPAMAANAFLSLSRVKLSRGAFRDVLADAEAGLDLFDTSAALRNAYSDILVPGLHVQRGLALAGMGRAEEAEKECGALAAGFPGYAYLSAGVFRIRLLAAARQADFQKANAIARTRSADLPITAKEELLCAMLGLAVDAEKDEDEVARVLAILKRNEEARAFVKLAAPGLAEAVGHLPSDHGKARLASALHEEEAPSSDFEQSARGSSPVERT